MGDVLGVGWVPLSIWRQLRLFSAKPGVQRLGVGRRPGKTAAVHSPPWPPFLAVSWDKLSRGGSFEWPALMIWTGLPRAQIQCSVTVRVPREARRVSTLHCRSIRLCLAAAGRDQAIECVSPHLAVVGFHPPLSRTRKGFPVHHQSARIQA